MSSLRSRDDWRGHRPEPCVFAPPAPSFMSPDTAPFDTNVAVQVRDPSGTYVLPFPCRRTKDGWTNANGSPLAVEIVGWRLGFWGRRRGR
jgi:hypothetical protein